MITRWLLIACAAVLVAGSILSLETFWDLAVVAETRGQHARHWLNCVFTATAALTGTGLSPYDVGHDFNRAGQTLILILMQTGGLFVLIAGAVIGWRFRRRFEWEPVGIRPRAGVGGLIAFVCLAALLIEALGAAALYALTPREGANAGDVAFASIFHAVSAFCNVGLTLPGSSLVDLRDTWVPYAGFLPLMVLGGVGGPVLYELIRRPGRRLSWTSRITLLATGGLIIGGAALLLAVESTTRWQLRYPREDTPGRLFVDDEAGVEDGAIIFSAATSDRAPAERMRTMPPGKRAAAALFHSTAARSAGFRVARMDEASISPAGRMLLMLLALTGGAIGGTAGGLRLVVVAVLIATLLGRRRANHHVLESLSTPDSTPPTPSTPDSPPTSPLSPNAPPPTPFNADASLPAPPGEASASTSPEEPSADGDSTLTQRHPPGHRECLHAAAAAFTGMIALVAATTLILVYRETGTLEACTFEAVSACCNVGFSTGLTRSLSVEGRVAIILAMLLGRILPLALLARAVNPPE
ncbi:MAG: hypothetical protein AMXMBFR13_37370 [Phycisphaerae bacterium]